jgi:hypothetical protein
MGQRGDFLLSTVQMIYGNVKAVEDTKDTSDPSIVTMDVRFREPFGHI